MADFLLQFTTVDSVAEEQHQQEQVVAVTGSASDVIELTNGFELPPSSLSQLLLTSGNTETEAFLQSTATATNALLGTRTASSSIPSLISTSTSTSTALTSSLVDVVDKSMMYAPSFPNYILENATGQVHQWSTQYLLSGNNNTSGYIDWDSGLRNSLYSDGDPMTSAAAASGQAMSVADCDDVLVSENGMTYQVVVYCMYIVIFVLALLGNGVVCYIVQSSPRMRTVTNYFIFNLAIGDVLMSLFCVPFSFISILILGYWPFGVILCHLVNYSQAISVLVSAYTLVAISVDRYIVIMWPLRPRITKR